jgi:hypothetical protein
MQTDFTQDFTQDATSMEAIAHGNEENFAERQTNSDVHAPASYSNSREISEDSSSEGGEKSGDDLETEEAVTQRAIQEFGLDALLVYKVQRYQLNSTGAAFVTIEEVCDACLHVMDAVEGGDEEPAMHEITGHGRRGGGPVPDSCGGPGAGAAGPARAHEDLRKKFERENGKIQLRFDAGLSPRSRAIQEHAKELSQRAHAMTTENLRGPTAERPRPDSGFSSGGGGGGGGRAAAWGGARAGCDGLHSGRRGDAGGSTAWDTAPDLSAGWGDTDGEWGDGGWGEPQPVPQLASQYGQQPAGFVQHMLPGPPAQNRPAGWGVGGGVRTVKKRRKRWVVIDGANVARQHGDRIFSSTGIEECVKFWKHAGYENVVAFVPAYLMDERRNARNGDGRSQRLDDLVKAQRLVDEKLVAKTPSGANDDLFVLKYAFEKQGLIVSNDHYRSEIHKRDGKRENWDVDRSELEHYIRKNRVSYSFVIDEFFPNPECSKLISYD